MYLVQDMAKFKKSKTILKMLAINVTLDNNNSIDNSFQLFKLS